MSTVKTPGRRSVFLAGSIEMGKAEDWQAKIQKEFRDSPVDIYNPRRDDWDSSWKQEITDPQFSKQVNWELDHLEQADFIFMYFSPETKAPISLLEMGLFAHSSKMIVVCPEGFYRKGNVDIVCKRNNIQVFTSLRDGIEMLKYILK
jgi:hypothetical protein